MGDISGHLYHTILSHGLKILNKIYINNRNNIILCWILYTLFFINVKKPFVKGSGPCFIQAAQLLSFDVGQFWNLFTISHDEFCYFTSSVALNLEPGDSRYIGCFIESDGAFTYRQYALFWWPYKEDSTMTVHSCIAECTTYRYRYAAMVSLKSILLISKCSLIGLLST